MKKALNLFLVMIMLFCFFAPAFPVKAASTYDVYLESGNSNTKQTQFATYKEAYSYAQSREKENQDYNLVIYQDGKVLYATYAIVNFNTKGNATTSYTIEYNNKSLGYTNGAYGADAAFLGTTEDGSRVRFKLAGVIGWVNASEVEIINMNAQNYKDKYISSYEIQDGAISHNISSTPHAYKMNRVYLSHEIPKEFQNKKYYLGYDGHYFYTESLAGFRAMIRDYKNNVHTSAINPTTPYYNYYQFLSHRSISNYTSGQLRQEFSQYKAKPVYGQTLQENQSLLFGEETSFIQYQNEFGANALLMYGVAKNESSSGRSPLSIRTNNIFSHSAFDSAPGANASSYASVAQAIYVHSKVFISERYAYPSNSNYFGSFVGDKGSGMNVRYASDPYWGEKAAQDYYRFEKKYGFQDYGKYAIGIKEGTGDYPIKATPSSSSATLYTTGPITNYAVTILSAVTGETINGNNVWYKIQTDPTLNSNKTGYSMLGFYDYEYNIGYIHSSYLTYVRSGNTEKKRYTIKFNPNGGSFTDNITTTKSLTVEEYVIPDINLPSKEGYRFIGWDRELEGATENAIYTALYEPLVSSYQITFNAGEGKFSDGSNAKKIDVKVGILPSIESPTREHYIFTGWTPVLEAATKNTTYTAQYKKETEIEWKETGGEFYFHQLSSNSTGLQITGYSTINGIEANVNSQISYEIQFENVDTKEVVSIPLNRIMSQNKMPFLIGKINGHDATYSWFDGIIPLKSLKVGNYNAYIIARSGELYTKKLVRNLFGKAMVGNYEQDGRQIWIRNNYYLKTVPMEFFVRNQIIGSKNNNPVDNMITGYSKIYFEGKQLKIRGFAHNVDGDYAPTAVVSRTVILENTKNYQTIKNSLPAITNGDYKISLRVSDGKDKTKAWFDGGIDVSALEKGTYVIYIANTANINDFAELNDIFGKAISSSTTINDKKYSLKVNADARYRIELIVE